MLKWAALLGICGCGAFVACSGFSSEDAQLALEAGVEDGAVPVDSSDEQDGTAIAKDAGAPADAGRQRMFVTSDTFDGQFSDFDSKCQAAADRASLGGTWVAWISTGTPESASARAKFKPGQGPWYEVSESAAMVFDRFPADGGEFLPVIAPNHDETGSVPADGGRLVWTGTKANGQGTASHCSNWSSNIDSDKGRTGDFSAISESWTNNDLGTPCNTFNHLYCFER